MSRRERSRFTIDPLALPDRLLLAAVVLLPWAFGGIEIWAYRCAALFIAAAVTVRLAQGESPPWQLVKVRAVLVPALLLLGIAVIQVVPLPPAAIGTLSPKAQELYSATFDESAPDPFAVLEQRALEQVPEAGRWPSARESGATVRPIDGRWTGWRTLSLVPAYTLERIWWFLALLLAFLFVQSSAADSERRRAFTAALFLNFLALAVFGLVYAAIGNQNVYWIRTTVEAARPFGPYVNPANFAAMMELAAPWVLASAISARRSERRPPLPFPILLVTGICCVMSGALSGSRAGVLLLGLGLLALVVRVPRRGRLIWTAASAAVAVLAAWLVTTSERLRLFFEFDGGGLVGVERISAWEAAIGMLGEFPLVGVGIGAFRDVFPIHAPAGGVARMKHLHNDYFEVALETGWPGAILLAWLVLAFALLAWRRSRRSLEGYGLLVGLGCLFLHAAVDFNHQIPANALTFVVVAAIAVARRKSP